MNRDEVRETFNAYSSTYAEAVDAAIAVPGVTGSYFTKVKADYLIDISRKRAEPASLTALDLGCGTGGFHPYLQGKFKSLAGVDISPESLGQAERANPAVDYSVYDGKTLPYEDSSFDLVFASCVFHHISPDERVGVLREARRVLRKGAMLVVFEHNTRNPLTRRTIADCPFDDDAIMIKPSELQALMADAGFQQPKQQTILSIPPVGRWGRNLDRFLGRVGLGAQYYVTGQTS